MLTLSPLKRVVLPSCAPVARVTSARFGNTGADGSEWGDTSWGSTIGTPPLRTSSATMRCSEARKEMVESIVGMW